MDPKLKQDYSEMEPTREELAGYRAVLARRLPHRKRVPLWWFALGGVPALALLVAFFLSSGSPNSLSFQQRSLDGLLVLVSQTPNPFLEKEAQRASESKDPLVQANACATLFLLADEGDRGIPLAARGLTLEPRSEVRLLYLEYLLDMVDGYRFNSERLEDLMRREVDPVCLKLYRQLLKVNNQTYFS